jgi:pilus assembly protein CpaC
MHIKPEVSTIDLNNAVTMSGFLIPALATRRMETDIELAEGQSFVIAGLIDNRVQETLSRIPGLSSIPLLGNLFKSREILKNLSELVVIVTPEIAKPLAPGEAAPIPAMPHEFLVPVTPDSRQNSSIDRDGPALPGMNSRKDKAAKKARAEKPAKSNKS